MKALALFALAVPALGQAAIVFSTGQLNEVDNLLFNEPGLPLYGNHIQGNIGNTGFHMDFFSSEVMSGQQAGGQAKIVSDDDGHLGDVKMQLTEFATFTRLDLNLFKIGTAGTTVVFTAELFGGGTVVSDPFTLSKNGENKFYVLGTEGDRMMSVSYVTSVGPEELKQVRVGGIQAVPEPASLGALAVGGFGLLARRRKK